MTATMLRFCPHFCVVCLSFIFELVRRSDIDRNALDVLGVFYKFVARQFLWNRERRISDSVGPSFGGVNSLKTKSVRVVRLVAIKKVWIVVSSLQGRELRCTSSFV